MTTPDGLALITWTDAAQITRGTATVQCAALQESGSRRPGYWPSRTYVCPVCGQAWMREEWKHKFQYRSAAGPLWVVVARECRWHGGGYLLDHLPLSACDDQILAREFKIYMDAYDHDNSITLTPIGGWRVPSPARAESAAPGAYRYG